MIERSTLASERSDTPSASLLSDTKLKPTRSMKTTPKTILRFSRSATFVLYVCTFVLGFVLNFQNELIYNSAISTAVKIWMPKHAIVESFDKFKGWTETTAVGGAQVITFETFKALFEKSGQTHVWLNKGRVHYASNVNTVVFTSDQSYYDGSTLDKTGFVFVGRDWAMIYGKPNYILSIAASLSVGCSFAIIAAVLLVCFLSLVNRNRGKPEEEFGNAGLETA